MPLALKSRCCNPMVLQILSPICVCVSSLLVDDGLVHGLQVEGGDGVGGPRAPHALVTVLLHTVLRLIQPLHPETNTLESV